MLKTYDSMEFDDLDAVRVVDLIDETGATESVEVVLEVPLEDQTYAIVTLNDPIVLLFKQDAQDEEAPLLDVTEEDFKSVKSHINNALIPLKVAIEERDEDFRLVGDLEVSAYEESDLIELNYDGDSIELLIIMTVDNAEQHYMVALPIEPTIYPVKLIDDQAHHLSDDELAPSAC